MPSLSKRQLSDCACMHAAPTGCVCILATGWTVKQLESRRLSGSLLESHFTGVLGSSFAMTVVYMRHQVSLTGAAN